MGKKSKEKHKVKSKDESKEEHKAIIKLFSNNII